MGDAVNHFAPVTPPIPAENLPAKRGRGQQTTYTEELADKICDAVADGTSIRALAKREDFPGRTTIARWMNEHPEFAMAYALACRDRLDSMAEDCIAIADDSKSDELSKARLRIDTRKWFLGKAAPKKYGEMLPAPAGMVEPTRNGDDAHLVNGGPQVLDAEPLDRVFSAFDQALKSGPPAAQ